LSSSSWLAFTPRDTVFIRDGRSFDAAADATAQTVWPSPTTIAGAVGAAYGTNPAEVRGPVLACQSGDGWEPYFPVPADVVVTANETPYAFRLERAGLEGQTDLDSGVPGQGRGDGPADWLVPPQAAGAVKPAEGWLPAGKLAAYLAGELPAGGGTGLADLGLVTGPLVPERRVGLARDAGRRARSGFFYQSTHLRPAEGWAFLAECTFGPGWGRRADGTVSFGGRGRLADDTPAQAEWPQASDGSVGTQVLVYLATPAIWPDGWRIPLPPGAWLVAAAIGEPQPTATVTPGGDWRRTRWLRWAVPAGSVYLLGFRDAAAGAHWAREVNHTAHGRDARDPLRTAGFGIVLTGVWT
jgi:CRISPR type III-B/RAMP module-associated protein Cmr3